jgi:hypothetical protein
MSIITTIHVYTSAQTAIRSCQEHGWRKIGIDLGKWKAEERDLLAERIFDDKRTEYSGARYGRPSGPHDLADPTPEGLLDHVQAGLIEQGKQQAEDEQKEAELAEARLQQTADDAEEIQAEVARLKKLPIEKLLKEPGIHEHGARVRLNTIMPRDWPRFYRAMERLGSPLPKDTHGTHECDAFAVSLLGRDDEIMAERERLAAAKEVERAEQEAAVAAKAVELARLEREILELIDPSILFRYDAGYLPQRERSDVLCTLLQPIVAGMRELSLPCAHRHDTTTFDGLTDEQHIALMIVQARVKAAPETPAIKDLSVEVRKRYLMDGSGVMIVRVAATICGHKVGVDRLLETPLSA